MTEQNHSRSEVQCQADLGPAAVLTASSTPADPVRTSPCDSGSIPAGSLDLAARARPGGLRGSPGLSYTHNRTQSVGVVLWSTGNRVDLCFEDYQPQEEPGALRGTISGFSAASRVRLTKWLNTLDRERVKAEGMLFITLTYPNEWDPSPERWKAHLKAFGMRWLRKFGRCPFVWKIEPQMRGAPHYHLLVLLDCNKVFGGLDYLKIWVSQAWYEVVDSGDLKHLRAGTKCARVKSWRGVASYTAKYISKQQGCFVDPDTGEVLEIGRWWGYWNVDLWPVSDVESLRLERTQAVRVRRVLRRYCHAQRRSALRARLAKAALEGKPVSRHLHRITSHYSRPVCRVSFFVEPADVRRLLAADLAPPGQRALLGHQSQRQAECGGRGWQPPRATLKGLHVADPPL